MIAYQGIEGSFSHQTALRLFSREKCIGFPTFEAVFQAVETGEADLALMPIENTLAGMIFETVDLLSRGNLHIIGETDTRIEHNLLALSGVILSEIRKVYSHPKALAQCTRFFKEHPEIEAVAHYDTAAAAADVAKMGCRSSAAIAHISAAPIYGLETLAVGIEDHAQNYTRFLLLSKEKSSGNKTALFFTLDHHPGSLARTLTEIARFGNLTLIASRPLIGHPYEYGFYVEIESKGPLLAELKTKTMKTLGTFHAI